MLGIIPRANGRKNYTLQLVYRQVFYFPTLV